jgi:ABC-type amino acid transport substrate-binding protein
MRAPKDHGFLSPILNGQSSINNRNDSGISIKKLEDARNYRVGSLNNTTGHIIWMNTSSTAT